MFIITNYSHLMSTYWLLVTSKSLDDDGGLHGKYIYICTVLGQGLLTWVHEQSPHGL